MFNCRTSSSSSGRTWNRRSSRVTEEELTSRSSLQSLVSKKPKSKRAQSLNHRLNCKPFFVLLRRVGPANWPAFYCFPFLHRSPTTPNHHLGIPKHAFSLSNGMFEFQAFRKGCNRAAPKKELNDHWKASLTPFGRPLRDFKPANETARPFQWWRASVEHRLNSS